MTMLTKRAAKRVEGAIVALAEAQPEGYISPATEAEFRTGGAALRTTVDAPRVTKAVKAAAAELARRKLNAAREL